MHLNEIHLSHITILNPPLWKFIYTKLKLRTKQINKERVEWYYDEKLMAEGFDWLQEA